MKRRYRVSITRGGYIYILLTIVIAVGAVNTGNNLLYLISSLMLSVMLLSGLSSLLNLTGLSAKVILPKEAFVGVPAPIGVKLNRKIHFLPAVLVGLGLADAKTRGQFIRPGEDSMAILWVIFNNRGLSRITHLEVFSGFPFGFFVRTRYIPINQEIVVFPSPIRTQLLPAGRIGKGEAASAQKKGVGDEVLELRPYQEGDSVKLLDWKATARRGEPVVKETASLVGDEVEVVVPPSATEEELGKATYLVMEGLKRGLRVGLTIGEKRFPPGTGEHHKIELLTALALA